MADRRGTCKNCGKRIVLWSGTEFWEHLHSGFYLCDNESTMAEPA